MRREGGLSIGSAQQSCFLNFGYELDYFACQVTPTVEAAAFINDTLSGDATGNRRGPGQKTLEIFVAVSTERCVSDERS